MTPAQTARFLGFSVFLLILSAAGQAQQNYGMTEFDASGSAEAQPAFLRGLLQLHNFEYPDARASFQEALAIDPEFTMAYWGEALTHDHPLWRQRYVEQSRAVLERLGPTPQARAARMKTQMEKDYLATIEILFGEGTQQERDRGYSEATRGTAREVPGRPRCGRIPCTVYPRRIRCARLLQVHASRCHSRGNPGPQPAASRRAALFDPQLRRSDPCAAGLTSCSGLLQGGAVGGTRPAHGFAHLLRAGHVGSWH